MVGIKVSTMVPQIGENWGSPLRFLGHPALMNTHMKIAASCGKFLRKSAQGRRTVYGRTKT